MTDFTIDRSSSMNTISGLAVAERALPGTSLMKKVATAALNVFSKGAKLWLVGYSLLQATPVVAQTSVPDFRVNLDPTGFQGSPSITSLKTGGFAIAWEGSDISAQIFDARGNRDGSQINLNTNTITTSYQGQVDLAALIGGGFVGTWNGAYDILGRVFNTSNEAPLPEENINTVTSNEQGAPAVVGTNDDGFFTTWHGGQAGNNDISARWYNASKAPQGSEFRVNTGTSRDQQYPAAIVLDDGSLVVAWHGAQTGDNDIYGQIFNATKAPEGAEIRLNSVRTGNQQFPGLTALKGGGFASVWMGAQSGDNDIYCRVYDAMKRALAAEFRVNTVTEGDQNSPAVDALMGGGFVVVWTSRNATNGDNNIAARIMNADGSADEPEFQANSETMGPQLNPDVAGLPYGGFVVTWEGWQTGSNPEIYARLFNSSGTPVLNFPAPPTYPSSSSSTYSTQAVVGSAPVPTPSPLSNGPTFSSIRMPSSTPTEQSSSSDLYSVGNMLKAFSLVYLKV